MNHSIRHRVLASLLALGMSFVMPARDIRGQEGAPAAPAAAAEGPATGGGSGLLDLDLDQLSRQDVVVPSLDTPVTSVSRQESTIGRSPAAVFVITNDMIRRSGATSVPEVLRMAPGVQVARIDSNKWAISARGFNNHFSSKLLVQIDRRVVYSPLFGGVYWDVQDLMLEDVDRIEVIRGPGTTAWGSNGVNGVVNIYTKRAADTQGTLVAARGGTYEHHAEALRQGGQVGENFHWRAYGKGFERGTGFSPQGAHDDWRQGRAGFRGDWTPTTEDTMTFQGDIYDGMSGGGLLAPPNILFGADTHVAGGNFLHRWTRTLDDDTEWQIQSYFDQTQRHFDTGLQDRRTMDFDFQGRFAPTNRHHVVCGGNYRRSHDTTLGTDGSRYVPAQQSINWASVFAEDRFTLVEDRWYVIGGCRLEYQTWGKVQPEPSARLLFLPSERQSCWAAVSRSARNPTRSERELSLQRPVSSFPPIDTLFLGSNNFGAEHLMAYELGYRAQPADFFSWDAAVFYNDYQDLAGTTMLPPFVSNGRLVLPITFNNALTAASWGAELATNLQMTDSWRLYGAYTYLQLQASGPDVGTVALYEGAVPHNQIYLQSSWDLSESVQFDLIGRYVDSLRVPSIPHYLTMDLRLGWRPTENAEFAVVGQNLLDGRHAEFIDSLDTTQQSTEVPRGVYGSFTWRR